jgi:Group II intron, maturase-specific domain
MGFPPAEFGHPHDVAAQPLIWDRPEGAGLHVGRAAFSSSLTTTVAGWMNYYGRFYRSQLYPFLTRINTYLMRWARKKYRRLHAFKRFKAWWTGLIDREPGLFTHWAWARTF